MMLVSVISSHSASGSRPVSASTAATVATNDGWPNCVPDTLTAMCRSAQPGRVARQCAVCRHASREHVRRPARTISPLSSATSMNSAAPSSPRVGCCQRASASNPMTRPGRGVDDRLVVHPQSGRRRCARRRSSWISSRRSTAMRSASSKISTRPRPRCLARYIATSASRSRSSGRSAFDAVGERDADAGADADLALAARRR